jgi:osmotically-inducible protein OsmY
VTPLTDVRLIALRQALNAEGFTSVQFHMDGNTMVLSGTVQSESDREMIRMACFNIGGVSSIQDNLRIADADAGG